MERTQTFGKQVQREPGCTNWTQQIDLCKDVLVDISDIGDIQVETYNSDEDNDDTSFGSDDDDEDCVDDVEVDDNDEGLMNSPISKHKEFKVVKFDKDDKSEYELDTVEKTETRLNKPAHQIALKRLSSQNVPIESCPKQRSLSGLAGLNRTEKSCEKSNDELDGGYETDLSTPAYLVALNELISQDVLIEPDFPQNTAQGMPPGPKSSNTILVNCLLKDSNKPIGASHLIVPSNFPQSELTDPSTIQARISESELIQPMCTQSALSNSSTIQPRAADTELIQPRSTDFLHHVPSCTQSPAIQPASATSTDYRKPGDGRAPVITPVLDFIGNGETTLKPSKIDKRKSFCLICKRNIFSCHRFSHPWAPKKILLCGHCNTDFPFIRFVQAHFRNIHEEHYKYFCDICHRALAPEELSSHFQKHQSPAYQCGVCKSDFTEFQELQKHLEIHEKKILYKCGICMMNFEETNELKKHFNIHFPGYFECEICKERRKTRHSLTRHMNSKHGQVLVSTNASIQDQTDPREPDLDKMEIPPSCSNTGYGQNDEQFDECNDSDNMNDPSNDYEIVDAHKQSMNHEMDDVPVLDIQTQLNNDLRWVMHQTMK